MSVINLTPASVTLGQLEWIYRSGSPVKLDRSVKPAVDAAARQVSAVASGADAVYGINTGFGKLANVKIAARDTSALQRNLILSHCSGVGEPIPAAITVFMMVL